MTAINGTCKDCKHWDTYFDEEVEEEFTVCNKIEVLDGYDDDKPRIALTEPDFGCTKFNNGELK